MLITLCFLILIHMDRKIPTSDLSKHVFVYTANGIETSSNNYKRSPSGENGYFDLIV